MTSARPSRRFWKEYQLNQPHRSQSLKRLGAVSAGGKPLVANSGFRASKPAGSGSTNATSVRRLSATMVSWTRTLAPALTTQSPSAFVTKSYVEPGMTAFCLPTRPATERCSRRMVLTLKLSGRVDWPKDVADLVSGTVGRIELLATVDQRFEFIS